MKRMRALGARMPLRVQLVAALVVLVTIALTAAGFAATASLRGYLLTRVDGQLVQAQHLYTDRAGRFGFGEEGGRDGRPQLPSNYVVTVCDAAGNPIGTSSDPLDAGESPPALPHLSVAQAAARADTPFTVNAVSGGTQWRVVAAPLPDGSGSIMVAQSLADVSSTVARLGFLEIVIGASVLVLLGGVGYVVVRRSLRPLVEVEETAAAIAAGDLSQRVPDRDPRTEVGRLSAAVNGMLTQIESAFRVREASEAAARKSEERMRRFVTDASHELRTPLTSIRGFAELFRQGAAASPDDVARSMRRIEDEAARMGLLVDDLLLLARLDQQRPLERQPVDLLTIASDAAHDARAVDPERPVELAVDGDRAPVVIGDESRLRQVLGNLVGNALTHTPPDSPVTVRVSTRTVEGAGWAVLEVTDKGPGLAPEDAERIFERFYRADPARSRDHARTGGGAGLGLSIVAALVAAHGGRVELETEPDQGSTFRVLLPLAPEA